MSTRRDFLRLSALTTLTTSLIPSIVRDANSHLSSRGDSTKKTVLFQGDSITDAGRDRANYYANAESGMGNGYVHDIVTHLLGKYPDRGFRFYNRGIGGQRVFELARRWNEDCLQLQPDVVSILIGVNDFWHTIAGAYQGNVDIYEVDYRALLQRTKKELPNARLIIGEPFGVEGGTAINEEWGGFDEYRSVARNLATEFGAVFIPYHTLFAEALKFAPVDYWCPDGVHPSLAGGYLMKEAWLAGFEGA